MTGLEGYYSIKNNKKMHYGYTTGSCAAGAAKAAASLLLLKREADTESPVSYTHLDVYKRQCQDFRRFRLLRRLM